MPHAYPSTLQELDALQATMNDALDAVRDEIKRNALPELSNYSTERHPLDDATFPCPPRLYEARRLAVATLGQLKHLLQRPYEKVVEQSCAVYDTACLDILVKTGLFDRLLDGAASVQALQDEFELDAAKLTVVMRYLSAQGWLYETKEGAFALTRPALELKKGNNGRKWIMTPGKPIVAQALMPQLTHSEWKYSRKPNETAFQIANKTPLTLFSWMKERPDDLAQWASSVQSLGDAYHAAIINDIPWYKFEGRTFVDCGGGQGNLSISLSEILPRSKFIVQDLPEVMPIASANIERRAPQALKEGRITNEPMNFFHVQPRVGDNHVYLLRYILHDWPDHACVSILNNVASVAAPDSRIMIIEVISSPNTVSVSPHDEAVTLDDLIGAKTHRPLSAPAFIPSNFGAHAKMSLALGVHMMGVFNAHERSMREWTNVIEKAGLRIVQVHALRGMVSAIECEPAPVGVRPVVPDAVDGPKVNGSVAVLTNGINGSNGVHINGTSSTNGVNGTNAL